MLANKRGVALSAFVASVASRGQCALSLEVLYISRRGNRSWLMRFMRITWFGGDRGCFDYRLRGSLHNSGRLGSRLNSRRRRSNRGYNNLLFEGQAGIRQGEGI